MQDCIEVQLSRVVIQYKREDQFVHLSEKNGSRTFPIVIGFHEVEEIQRKLRKKESVRPMTHDLVGRVLAAVGYRLDRIVISELRDHTFYANLVLVQDTADPDDETAKTESVDCRPSDAIALAVQTGARIFVARAVMDAVALASDATG